MAKGGKSGGGKKASSRRSNPLRRWFSHRHLLTVEAILVVGALETWLEGLVMASTWANWVKVLFAMLLVVGMFGAILVLAQRWAVAGLGKTHGVVQNLPLPTPMLVVHLLVLIGLFLLWSLLLELPPW